jgi:hypothetical protein
MCDIPEAIANEETVVRALRECHVRKGGLRPNVFRSMIGIDEVSVMRHSYMKSDACKAKAKEIASKNGDGKNPYVGFAAVLVGSVRSVGSQVNDSREEFCGHAHISHGVVVAADEPLDPKLLQQIKALQDQAKVLFDPSPETENWTGAAMDIPPI